MFWLHHFWGDIIIFIARLLIPSGGLHDWSLIFTIFRNLIIVPAFGYITQKILGLKGFQGFRHGTYMVLLNVLVHIVVDYVTNYGVIVSLDYSLLTCVFCRRVFFTHSTKNHIVSEWLLYLISLQLCIFMQFWQLLVQDGLNNQQFFILQFWDLCCWCEWMMLILIQIGFGREQCCIM